jgi:hypothetical protein
MKRGNDQRDSSGQPSPSGKSREIPVLMFVMAEKASGAFTLRLVTNEDVLGDIQEQGALEPFLRDADELYADFRGRFDAKKPQRIN